MLSCMFFISHVVHWISLQHVTWFTEAEVKSDRSEDKEEADGSGSSSSSSSSSSSGSDSDSSNESGEEDDNKSEAEIKGLKDDDDADKSQRGETNSSAEVDAAASPREGAVSPTPDSELPKITVTPQGDSPRSQTSNKTNDVENASETPRPVTRMQKRGDRICLNLIGSCLQA